MGWESIGECIGSDSTDPPPWITFCHKTTLAYIETILGSPPDGWVLGVQWHDHDLGSYPTIGVYNNLPVSEPWEYIRKAEELLDRFNDAVDWSEIEPSAVLEDDEEDDPE
jgi:hypothetical protein